MRLIKETSAQWLGNGMGSSAADWVVKGAEHIKVYKGVGGWKVQDTLANSTLVRFADSRKQALEIYEQICNAI